jgi:hypothetical protein
MTGKSDAYKKLIQLGVMEKERECGCFLLSWSNTSVDELCRCAVGMMEDLRSICAWSVLRF